MYLLFPPSLLLYVSFPLPFCPLSPFLTPIHLIFIYIHLSLPFLCFSHSPPFSCSIILKRVLYSSLLSLFYRPPPSHLPLLPLAPFSSLFSATGAKMYLFLKKRKANQWEKLTCSQRK